MEHSNTLYFKRDGILYRIRVNEGSVWMEQQTPHIMAANQHMVEFLPMDVYGGLSWNLDTIDAMIKKYQDIINS